MNISLEMPQKFSSYLKIVLCCLTSGGVGCATLDCDDCTDQYLYSIYRRVPGVVSRDVLYAGSDRYYGVRFADGSSLGIRSPLNLRCQSVVIFPSDLPAFARDLNIGNVVMMRTALEFYGDSIRYSYRSALLNLDVSGCMNDSSCIAASVASEEIVRFLGSSLFRSCCLQRNEGR